MDSNQGPSACKADALNQLSYAPKIEAAKVVIISLIPNVIDEIDKILSYFKIVLSKAVFISLVFKFLDSSSFRESSKKSRNSFNDPLLTRMESFS